MTVQKKSNCKHNAKEPYPTRRMKSISLATWRTCFLVKMYLSGKRVTQFRDSEHLYEGRISLCLTEWTLRHKDVWGSECLDPHILYLRINRRWVVTFTPRLLYPGGKSPGDCWIGGRVGPSTGLGDVEWRNVFHRDSNSNPRSKARSQ
jgi:hypothetical protein